ATVELGEVLDGGSAPSGDGEDRFGCEAMSDDVDDNPVGQALQFSQRLVMQGQQLAGTDKQLLTCRCQRHPTRGPVEQPYADPFLEPPDVTGEGLLSHEQPTGGSREVQLLGDRDEVAEETHVELSCHSSL